MIYYVFMLRYYLNEALNLIFPRLCLICGIKLKDNTLRNLPAKGEVRPPEARFARGDQRRPICSDCVKKVEPNLPPYCTKCGVSLPGRYDATIICSACSDAKYYFNSAQSPYIYEEVMKECIHILKYRKMLQVMYIFKEVMAQRSISLNPCFKKDIIIPVPLHKARLRQRGFNQAELLSGLIGELSGSVRVHTGILKRVKPTLPQSELDRHKRMDNIKGAFRVILPEAIKDKEVLLIDDVFTTGSTANECARVLIEAGARKVDVFTLARTRGTY